MLRLAWLRGFVQGSGAAIQGLFGEDEERIGAVAEVQRRIANSRENDEDQRADLWDEGAEYILGSA